MLLLVLLLVLLFVLLLVLLLVLLGRAVRNREPGPDAGWLRDRALYGDLIYSNDYTSNDTTTTTTTNHDDNNNDNDNNNNDVMATIMLNIMVYMHMVNLLYLSPTILSNNHFTSTNILNFTLWQ